jgi:ketosteroid isomerase-like protein
VTSLTRPAGDETLLAPGSVGDTGREVSEESTTPDPVGLVRRQVKALNRGDHDGVMRDVAEDVVLEGRALGDFFEGRAAVRGFLDDWFRLYGELAFELEEVSHLGGGVVFAVVVQEGRLLDTDGHIHQREGWIYLCVGGAIASLTVSDVDAGRAAAERLARERG